MQTILSLFPQLARSGASSQGKAQAADGFARMLEGAGAPVGAALSEDASGFATAFRQNGAFLGSPASSVEGRQFASAKEGVSDVLAAAGGEYVEQIEQPVVENLPLLSPEDSAAGDAMFAGRNLVTGKESSAAGVEKKFFSQPVDDGRSGLSTPPPFASSIVQNPLLVEESPGQPAPQGASSSTPVPPFAASASAVSEPVFVEEPVAASHVKDPVGQPVPQGASSSTPVSPFAASASVVSEPVFVEEPVAAGHVKEPVGQPVPQEAFSSTPVPPSAASAGSELVFVEEPVAAGQVKDPVGQPVPQGASSSTPVSPFAASASVVSEPVFVEEPVAAGHVKDPVGQPVLQGASSSTPVPSFAASATAGSEPVFGEEPVVASHAKESIGQPVLQRSSAPVSGHPSTTFAQSPAAAAHMSEVPGAGWNSVSQGLAESGSTQSVVDSAGGKVSDIVPEMNVAKNFYQAGRNFDFSGSGEEKVRNSTDSLAQWGINSVAPEQGDSTGSILSSPYFGRQGAVGQTPPIAETAMQAVTGQLHKMMTPKKPPVVVDAVASSGSVMEHHLPGALSAATAPGSVPDVVVTPSGTRVPAMDVVNQVVAQIPASANITPQRIVLQLHPRELGPVTLHVSVRKDQVHARIEAGSEQVLEVLGRHLPRLQSAMAEQNVAFAGMELSLGTGGQQEQQQGNGNARFTPFGHGSGGGSGLGDGPEDEILASETVRGGYAGDSGLSVRV